MTEILYYEYPMVVSCTAKVVSCAEKDGAYLVALDHADALLIPGGRQKGMWRAARSLIEQFKACGHPVYAACKDMQGEKQ